MSVERIPLSTAPSEFVLAPIRTMNAPPTNIADIPEEESNNPCMTYVERESLYTSLPDRVQYLTSFLGFTEADADELHEASMILEPHIGTLVDGVYAHLFKFSVTRQVFMPRPGGHEGPMVADLRDLDLDCPQIKERKRFFSMYVRKLIQSDYNDFKTWEYYDKVGLMHTGEAALKHRKLVGKDGLRVDHIHLSATLGWTMDRIIAIILRDESLTISKRESIVRSFHKVMWIQQDLFSRHYVRDGDEYRKSPRTMAGSRLRPQPGPCSASSGDASVSCPMSFGGDSSYDHPHPSNPTSPTQSSASITTSVTGADSVRWTPQAVSGVQVRAPDDHYDAWGKGPVSSQQIPLRSKPSEDWSKAIGRERSASNLEDIHAQVAANRPGVWRRIFGGV